MGLGLGVRDLGFGGRNLSAGAERLGFGGEEPVRELRRDVMQEALVVAMLRGCPRAVQLHDVFATDHQVVLITEM